MLNVKDHYQSALRFLNSTLPTLLESNRRQRVAIAVETADADHFVEQLKTYTDDIDQQVIDRILY